MRETLLRGLPRPVLKWVLRRGVDGNPFACWLLKWSVLPDRGER